ncbi:D-ribose pyranase [Labrys monachus]|uniref:D-ribose pyranase n=1 Tax=Labrys monachus TaxID=217067 RepID=A0ABU0FGA9_9HYPH|nr:D-ribose pyranase [Labrys monachus]MDQ0393090.1 simple sugar transport system permease protein/D-ribose pyranase [Labrys monachus]
MKRNGILNQALSEAIASMGHGEIMMIVDAGFPIPRDAWRVDLAISPNLPTLAMLYEVIAPELIVEKIMFAGEVAEHNIPLYRTLRTWFDERDFAPVTYEETVGPLAQKAKVIVRSGALDPWGNIALVAGVDYRAYFRNPEISVPERFRALMDRTPFVPGASRS